MVSSFCDLDYQEIPLPVTITGTVVGVLGGTLLWPLLPATAVQHGLAFPLPLGLRLTPGIYSWPVWYSLPSRLSPDSPLTGLVTGLAGASAGMLLLRGLRFVFGLGRGKEGLGIGDADLMMMAGSFLGWQPIVMAFLIAVFPGLLFAIVHVVFTGVRSLRAASAKFPGLLSAIVQVITGQSTIASWAGVGHRSDDYHAGVAVIGPEVQLIFFSSTMLVVAVGGGGVMLFLLSFLLRLLHRKEINKQE